VRKSKYESQSFNICILHERISTMNGFLLKRFRLQTNFIKWTHSHLKHFWKKNGLSNGFQLKKIQNTVNELILMQGLLASKLGNERRLPKEQATDFQRLVTWTVFFFKHFLKNIISIANGFFSLNDFRVQTKFENERIPTLHIFENWNRLPRLNVFQLKQFS
jgi:hypothetical protein